MPVHKHPVAPLETAIPLDQGVISRLRDSFGRIRQCGDALGEDFYTRLFAAAPHLRPMFRSDPKVQSAKLIASLEAIVRNLEAPARNAAMLSELGKRHAGYGARPEHYVLVVDLLVQSIRAALGPEADARTLEEWRTALTLVSKHMIAAAGQPT